jgi:hypothetical protein
MKFGQVIEYHGYPVTGGPLADGLNREAERQIRERIKKDPPADPKGIIR